ncbi:GntR family transcriptional regulator [Paenarthrobacter sp. A20]|uniref:GntR family transcriptional regulator n=1 Tax=Paenarthrobacter sp. A20 TaxID=2817891 RepID=UPI0020A121E1|nr:GntR family transcriptional regulator [Paenarthrobacter sp. A20]MCP1415588.1 GntR family transcriptional regulator [Paenarthrobacter sp. A20]
MEKTSSGEHILQPAYVRISDDLRSRIRGGDLKPHAPLPPERELCLDHGVSRMTARRALNILESEGLVYRDYRDGKRGTFVSEPRIELRLGSFSREISKAGRHPGAELLWAEKKPASHAQAAALGIDTGASVVALQRLRRSDNEPLALETTFYPAHILPGFLKEDLSGSLWDVLRNKYAIIPARTVANLEVVVLDQEASHLLQTRQAAAGLRLIRRTFDKDGKCFEYAEDTYRADRVSLVIDREIDE